MPHESAFCWNSLLLPFLSCLGSPSSSATIPGEKARRSKIFRKRPEAYGGSGLQVPLERRINRATAATWHFEEGAVGSLFHSVVLEGSRFTAEVDIYCDGGHLQTS